MSSNTRKLSKRREHRNARRRNPGTKAVLPARRRSAELYPAVSQICNLLNPGIIQRATAWLRPADYKSAIQQIENLRYDSGLRHGRVPWPVQGRGDSSTIARSPSEKFGRRITRRPSPGTKPALPARRRSAELYSAVSQICNLLNPGIIQSATAWVRPADCKSAIQQIENLRYDSGRLYDSGLRYNSDLRFPTEFLNLTK